MKCFTTFIISIILVTFFNSKIFSQDKSNVPGINTGSYSTLSTENQFSYRSDVQNFQTDEYGSLTYNSVLAGLGSSGNCVNVSHNSLFDQNTDGSFEMWVNPSSVSVNAILVSKGSTNLQSFLWGIASGSRQMYLRIGNTVYSNSDGDAIPLNTWSHIAVTWSGGPNFIITFYYNGNQSGSQVSGNASWNLNSDPLRIGASQYFTTEYFTGQIDEARFWEDVRTVQEIRDNRFVGLGDGTGANSGYALTGSSHYANLIASWTFNKTGTAFDDINGLNGNYYGSAVSALTDLGVPMPYNMALRCFGGSGDKLFVADHSSFDQSSDGTIELWFKPVSVSTDQIIISKGSTINNISFLFGMNNTGRLYLRFGANAIASNGSPISPNVWQHIAVTWFITGGQYQVKFWVNGVQNGTTLYLPGNFYTNTARCFIGGSEVYLSNTVNGYIDELRIWHPALSADQIIHYMFASGRSLLPNSNLLAIWNFDGNLLNFSSGTGLNGSFNTGTTNNARLSGFLNESSPGAYGTGFISHATVINRGGTPNSFPNGFYKSAPFMTIPDNNTTGVTNTIIISNNSGNVANIEVFISVQHTWIGDLVLTLTAPNGQSRTIISNNGGAGDNILSFFGDAFNYLPSSAIYLPPWGFIKPIVNFGNIGNSVINGTWTLKAVDNAGGDQGVLQGWGLRFNNQTMVGTEQISSNLPDRFTLYQNYPNPFNPKTTIRFDLAANSRMKIVLFDLLGREILTIAEGEYKAGSYKSEFDASMLSSGVYFYKITAGDFTDTKKMMLVK